MFSIKTQYKKVKIKSDRKIKNFIKKRYKKLSKNLQKISVKSIIRQWFIININSVTPEKKKILKKILTALVPYRELAEWFLLLLEEKWNEEIEEKLYQKILREIRNINSKTQQENIRTALQKLKEKSETVTKTEEKEAEEMLDDFMNNV